MNYCPNCGAELVPGAKFCGNCGAEIGAAATASHPAPADQPQPPTPPTTVPLAGVTPVPTAPHRHGKQWWLIAAAVIVIAIGGGWWSTHRYSDVTRQMTQSHFRQATVYAWQGSTVQKYGGVSATTLKTDVAYVDFAPNGKVYWFDVAKLGQKDYEGTASRGTYRLTHHQLTFKLTDPYYSAFGKSVESLAAQQPKIAYPGKSKQGSGLQQFSLVHGRMQKFTYTNTKGKATRETFTPSVVPVTVAEGGINAQAIYTRWQAAKH